MADRGTQAGPGIDPDRVMLCVQVLVPATCTPTHVPVVVITVDVRAVHTLADVQAAVARAVPDNRYQIAGSTMEKATPRSGLFRSTSFAL